MTYWLEVNLYLALLYLLFVAGKFLLKGNEKLDYSKNILYFLPLMLLLPFLRELMPMEVPLPPVLAKASEGISPFPLSSHVVATSPGEVQSVDFNRLQVDLDTILLALFVLGLGTWFIRFLSSLQGLRRIIHESVDIRVAGKTKILVNSNVKTPCSFWLFGSYVLLPENILDQRQELLMVLSHELQHHRQGDTRLIYFLELIKGLFFFNPFIHRWIKEMNLLQEIRCDQKVMERKSYTPKEYVETLYRIVQINSGVIPQGTLAMASYHDLTRRIEMITRKSEKTNLLKRMALLGLSLGLIWQVACATTSNLGLTKLTLSEAQALAGSIDSEIPIEVNASVLKWLNYYLGDSRGQAYILKTRANMVQYAGTIKDLLKQNGLPEELIAIPFMESGFNNEAHSSMKARGLWQFIPQTAKIYGLKVNEQEDERLNVEKSTKAAIKYYQNLLAVKDFHKDWRLALLAYNTGENHLVKAMKKQGTQDPWAFTGLGDKEYLAKIMAGIILVKNPKRFFTLNPVFNSKRTSAFGSRTMDPQGEHFHSGIDLGAKMGSEIKSPMEGVVVEVSEKFEGKPGLGKVIVLDHGNDIQTRYYHLNSFLVKKGQTVKAGQIIGGVGNTGVSSGPHLHFEVLINGKQVNPEIFF